MPTISLERMLIAAELKAECPYCRAVLIIRNSYAVPTEGRCEHFTFCDRIDGQIFVAYRCLSKKEP